MGYQVEIKRSAAKEIAALPKRDRRRVVSAIEALADDTRPEGARKLTNIENAYRIRVGDYRVVYQIVDNILTVFIVCAGHRKDMYRRS